MEAYEVHVHNFEDFASTEEKALYDKLISDPVFGITDGLKYAAYNNNSAVLGSVLGTQWYTNMTLRINLYHTTEQELADNLELHFVGVFDDADFTRYGTVPYPTPPCTYAYTSTLPLPVSTPPNRCTRTHVHTYTRTHVHTCTRAHQSLGPGSLPCSC